MTTNTLPNTLLNSLCPWQSVWWLPCAPAALPACQAGPRATRFAHLLLSSCFNVISSLVWHLPYSLTLIGC